jgi:WD40 repeat protein
MPHHRILGFFIGLMMLTFSVVGQEEVRTYSEIDSYELGTVNDLLTLLEGYLVAATDEGIRLFTYPEFEQSFVETDSPVTQIYDSFSGDELDVLAVYADNSVGLWDLEAGREITRFNGHDDKINEVIPLQDKFITSSDEGTVRQWPYAFSNGEYQLIYQHEAAVTELAYYYQGQVLASSSGNTLHLWHVSRQEEIGLLTFDSEITGIAFGEATNRLAVGTVAGTIHILEATSPATYEYEGASYSLYDVPMPDGSEMVLALITKGRRESIFIDPNNPSGGEIVWEGNWRGLSPAIIPLTDTNELAIIEAHDSPISELHLSSSLSLLSFGEDHSIGIWGWEREEFYRVPANPDVELINVYLPTSVLFYATVDTGGDVLISHAHTGLEFARLPDNSARTTHLNFLPVNQWVHLASATEDGILHIWEWDNE